MPPLEALPTPMISSAEVALAARGEATSITSADIKAMLTATIQANGNDFVNIQVNGEKQNIDPIPVPDYAKLDNLASAAINVDLSVAATDALAAPGGASVTVTGVNADNNIESPPSTPASVKLPKTLCPTCHSVISSIPTHRTQAQDAAGEYNSSVSGAIPQWSDDPLVTIGGFSGINYRGTDRIRRKHIEELQTARGSEEQTAGLDYNEVTKFSELETVNFHVRKTHIAELRQSIEKILDAVGSNLKEYFSTDADGNMVDPGPNDVIKTDWTDVDRGQIYLDKDGIPVDKQFMLPSGKMQDVPAFPRTTHIRAIHIEDLRHPIQLGWREFWSVSPAQTVTLPTDYSQLRWSKDTWANPGPPSNWPGISYGVSETSEYLLMPNPGQTYDFDQIDYYSSLHRMQEKGTCTEAGKYGFPSGFDIHGSDAGNKYIYEPNKGEEMVPAYGTKTIDPKTGNPVYIIDRTWIVNGYCSTTVSNWHHDYYVSGGEYCGYVWLIHETTDSNLLSNVVFEIMEAADSLVTAAKADAKTLKITAQAEANYNLTGPVAAGIPPHSWGYGNIIHIGDYTPNYMLGYPISRGIETPNPEVPGSFIFNELGIEAKANRKFAITKDTCFKFFANVTYDGTNPKSNPKGLTDKDEWAKQYRGDMLAYLAGSGCEENGEEPTFAMPGSPDNTPAFSYGFASCMLYGLAGWGNLVIRIILDKPPNSYPADATVIGQGKYGGQQFVFASPTYPYSGGSPNIEAGIMAIFLGEGNAGKGKESFRFNKSSIINTLEQYKSKLNFNYQIISIKKDILIEITNERN